MVEFQDDVVWFVSFHLSHKLLAKNSDDFNFGNTNVSKTKTVQNF